jgi:long-chain fatty acid transport protein
MMFKQTIVSLSVAGALLAMSGSASASGFALTEQNASGLGNAYSGGAAIAEDASTIYFNPAGMTRLHGSQVVASVAMIKPSATFSGTGANSNMGGDAGSLATVPDAYYATELKPGLQVGVGVNVPFGLKTEYDPAWTGRSQAIKSSLDTINVNPSIAYQVNDQLSIGVGIDYQHIKGELSSYGGAILGTEVVQGSDNAWGYNLGGLYQLNPDTRVGVAYRSAISYTLSGTVTTSLPAANGPASLDIKLPDSLSVSGVHRLNDQVDLMADVTWTGWSCFKQVKVVDANGAAISNTIENWKDTYRFSIGATRHYNEKWTTRIGLAYDQSPVPDANRTARIPDNNRTWLALGGQYKPSNSSAIDFGYAHLFVKDATINSPSPAPALVGTYKLKVDILNVQYTYKF